MFFTSSELSFTASIVYITLIVRVISDVIIVIKKILKASNITINLLENKTFG